LAGYLSGNPWPAEDGGPQRLQAVDGLPALGLRAGERLASRSRNTLLSTMSVLGAPGEVYLLTHSALRARVGLATTACVERVDPVSLRTTARSPRLAGGPMWPGGMAVHRNGDLYLAYGRHLHRLDRQCRLKGSLALPAAEPYNSFVVLDDGMLVTKNLSDRNPARLSIIDPDTMLPACAEVECPEPSIARLSALGRTVYVVGVRSVFRYHWDPAARRLLPDPDWRFDYVGNSAQTWGWDAVIDGEHAWFMDNGAHRYLHSMIGRGVSRSANRLIRVSLRDAHDHQALDICGLGGGSITNPPLVDPRRHIVLGYDSANRFLQAWRFEAGTRQLVPIWQRHPFGCASHMLLYPASGEVVINDYRRLGEEVVVLDIETGTERGRVRVGGLMQGVVFPSPGWGRDFYWSSMGRFSRVYVT
jgi:hypothetical protein